MNSLANWQLELTKAFRDVASLEHFLGEQLPHSVAKTYPVLIPYSLAQKIKSQGIDGVLGKQFLPHAQEASQEGLLDPIGDQTYASTGQVIHRYHNRALLIPTTVCPVNCRYCFRKNELQEGVFAQDREATLNYLQSHTEIDEVIFTGGDPLMLTDEKISHWLKALEQISHIKYVRFHTRFPVIYPSRLTPSLSSLFESFSARFKILMVVHTNHSSEWDEESSSAVLNFRPRGLRWLSQSVLLKGVNNSPSALIALFKKMSSLNIEAYYLHHPDQVKGGMHFWLSLEEGRQLWAQLHNQVPGWMLPQYVIDIPGGHGKVAAFNPEGITFSGSLLDREGQLISILGTQIQKVERSPQA